jgi:hypothetical protein
MDMQLTWEYHNKINHPGPYRKRQGQQPAQKNINTQPTPHQQDHSTG